MEAAHLGWRAWVENEFPRVSEVLEKFRLKHVSHITYIEMETVSSATNQCYLSVAVGEH